MHAGWCRSRHLPWHAMPGHASTSQLMTSGATHPRNRSASAAWNRAGCTCRAGMAGMGSMVSHACLLLPQSSRHSVETEAARQQACGGARGGTCTCRELPSACLQAGGHGARQQHSPHAGCTTAGQHRSSSQLLGQPHVEGDLQAHAGLEGLEAQPHGGQRGCRWGRVGVWASDMLAWQAHMAPPSAAIPYCLQRHFKPSPWSSALSLPQTQRPRLPCRSLVSSGCGAGCAKGRHCCFRNSGRTMPSSTSRALISDCIGGGEVTNAS